MSALPVERTRPPIAEALFVLPSVSERFKDDSCDVRLQRRDTVSISGWDWQSLFVDSAQGSIFLTNLDSVRELEGLFKFENAAEVRRFLYGHDRIARTLFGVCEQVRRFFGTSVSGMTLKYDHDPDEDFEGLFVSIRTNLPPGESLDLLDKFDEEWFLDNVDSDVGSQLDVMVA
jgi:hypothetical protein